MRSNTPNKTVIQYTRDILFYAPAKILPALINIAALSFFTRYLTSFQYGLYTLTMTSIGITAALCFGWLNQTTLRLWNEQRKRQNAGKILSTGLTTLFGLIIIIGVIYLLAIRLLGSDVDAELLGLHKTSILLLASNSGFFFAMHILMADRGTFKYALYSFLRTFMGISFSIIVLRYSHMGPKGIILSMSAVTFVLFSFQISTLLYKYGYKPSNFSLKLLKNFGRYGLPLTVVSFGSVILESIDRYMLAYFVNPGCVGIYSAGYTIGSNSITSLNAILLAALFPIVIQFVEKNGRHETKIVLSRAMGVFLLILVPATSVMSVLSVEITALFLSPSFRSASTVVPWIGLGAAFRGLANISLYPHKIMKQTKTLGLFVLVSAALNISFNWLLIPQIGMLGAAISTTLSYFAYLCLTYSSGQRLLRYEFPWHALVASVVSSIIVCIFLIVWHFNTATSLLNLILSLFISILIYLMVLIALKEHNTIYLMQNLSFFRLCPAFLKR